MFDGVRFALQNPLGQPIRRNPPEGHSPRLLVLIVNIDGVTLHQEVVGAVQARGACPYDRYAGFGFVRDRADVFKELGDRRPGIVRHVALHVADRHRRIHPAASAGRFAGTHADAAAGRDQGIVLQQHAHGEIRMAVSYIIDVARNVDVRRTGLDALGGHGRIDVAGNIPGIGHEAPQKETDGADHRGRRRKPDAAETCFLHLFGAFEDVIPVYHPTVAVDRILQRRFHQNRRHAARGAAPAARLTGAAVVAQQNARERHFGVKDEKALRPHESINGVAGIEIRESREVQPFGSLIAPLRVVVLDAVPDAVQDLSLGHSLFSAALSSSPRRTLLFLVGVAG